MFTNGSRVFFCGEDRTNGRMLVKFMDLLRMKPWWSVASRNSLLFPVSHDSRDFWPSRVKQPGRNILSTRLQIGHAFPSTGPPGFGRTTSLLPSCWHCTLVYTSSLSKSLRLPLSHPCSGANAFWLFHSFSLTWNVSFSEPPWLWLTEE